MSTILEDKWAKKAMADDTVVAKELVRLHHQPSLRHVLTHWPVRQRRTSRLPVPTAQPARISPAIHASQVVDQSEIVDKSEIVNAKKSTEKGATVTISLYGADQSETVVAKMSSKRKAEAHSETVDGKRSKKLKVVDKSKTIVVKKILNKRLYELKREVKLRLTEKKDLKDELKAMKLTFEKEKALNETLMRRKLDQMSRRPIETLQAILDSPQFEGVHCVPSDFASSQTVKDKTLEDRTLCAASARQEINGQQPSFLLPDLNIPPKEFFTDFVLD